MASLRDLFVKIGFEADSAPIEKIDKGLNQLKSTAKGVAFQLIAATGAATGLGFILKKAGGLEQTTIAFETMLRSASKAQKLLQDLFDFAGTTPFQIPDILKNARQLLAMGISLKNILPDLRSLGNAAAGLAVPVQRLAFAFGQVRARTVLSGIELRTFVRAGVPLLDELGKMLGKTAGEIKKMTSKGKISFEQVRQAFRNMSAEGGIFFRLTEKQSQSLFGLWSIIQDQITLIAQATGGDLLKSVKQIQRGILDFFKANKKLIQQKLGKFLSEVGEGFAFSFKILMKIVSVLGELTKLFGGLGNTIKLATIALAGFTAVSFLSGIGNLALGIGRLIFSFRTLGTAALFAQAKMLAVPLLIGLAFGAVILIIEDVIKFFAGGKSLTGLLVKAFRDQYPAAFETTRKGLERIKELLGDIKDFFTDNSVLKFPGRFLKDFKAFDRLHEPGLSVEERQKRLADLIAIRQASPGLSGNTAQLLSALAGAQSPLPSAVVGPPAPVGGQGPVSNITIAPVIQVTAGGEGSDLAAQISEVTTSRIQEMLDGAFRQNKNPVVK